MAKFKVDGMFATYDVSANKENYSQNNNLYRYVQGLARVTPATECNVTSMVMGGDYAGYGFPSGKYAQSEDNFADFMISSPEVDAKYKETMPAMYADWKAGKKGSYPPNEIHSLLSFGFNLWLGTTATYFSTNTPIQAIIDDITQKALPVVMSGKFGNLGHIVCLVGLVVPAIKTEGRIILDDVKDFLIDDPYGNYLSGYSDGAASGNNIVMPKADFLSIFKPLGDDKVKWSHRFNQPAALTR